MQLGTRGNSAPLLDSALLCVRHVLRGHRRCRAAGAAPGGTRARGTLQPGRAGPGRAGPGQATRLHPQLVAPQHLIDGPCERAQEHTLEPFPRLPRAYTSPQPRVQTGPWRHRAARDRAPRLPVSLHPVAHCAPPYSLPHRPPRSLAWRNRKSLETFYCIFCQKPGPPRFFARYHCFRPKET